VEDPTDVTAGGTPSPPTPVPGTQSPNGGPQTPPPPQARRAAAAVVVFCLVVSVVYLAWLCLETISGSVRGDRGSGYIALLVFQNESLHLLLKGTVGILSFGAAVIAEARNRPRLYYAVVILCVIGVIECGTITALFAGYDVASLLYDYPGGSSITSFEKLQSATRISMGGLAFWYLAVLSTQFGLSLPSTGRAGT
jgi:hypothetical protein